MVANAEASASLDLLRAAKTIATRRGDKLAAGVLVTGFSQGGAAAMAVGRALQHHALPAFHLLALAPISGPYDLPGAELPGIFNGQIAAAIAPYYIGYTLTALPPVPGPQGRLPPALRRHRGRAVLRQPPPPADHHRATAPATRPAHHQVPAPLAAPTGALKAALIRNSTCTGWTPRVPVRLYAASGDTTVTHVNAQHCRQTIRAHHGHVRLVQLGAVSHNISDFLALPRIVRWFHTFR